MAEKTSNNVLTTGRRKVSVARAKVVKGTGTILVNKLPILDYFKRETLVNIAIQPLAITDNNDKFDISLNVNGGGHSGQAGAIRHAIARALLILDPGSKASLKKASMLTRDPRMKERKKYGQKGARARFQFSKR